MGSPPRARGKGSIAPNRAQTTMDHPRVRGEKPSLFVRDGESSGSPPRARGKGFVDMRKRGFKRITPACAGKRSYFSTSSLTAWDHPRVRGEKPAQPHWRCRNWGSPPRARGKGVPVAKAPGDTGITPACAGKRRGRWRDSRRAGDHPRVRGEKIISTVVSGWCGIKKVDSLFSRIS